MIKLSKYRTLLKVINTTNEEAYRGTTVCININITETNSLKSRFGMKNYRKDKFCMFSKVMCIAFILVIVMAFAPYLFNNPVKIEQSIKLFFGGSTALGTIGVAALSVLTVFRHERNEKNNRLQEKEEQLRQKTYQAYEKIIELNNQIKDMQFFYATYKGYGCIKPFSASYFSHERDIKDALGKLNYTAKKLLDSVTLTSAFMVAYLPKNENFQKAECAIRGFVDVIQKINEGSCHLTLGKQITIHTMEDKVEEDNLNNAKEYLDNTLIDLNKLMQDEELKKLALQKQSVQSKDEK